MKATANGRSYEAATWPEVLVTILMREAKRRTTSSERSAAVNQMKSGVSVVIGGVLIKPEGARE